MKIEIGSTVKVVIKEHGGMPDVGTIGTVVGQGVAYGSQPPFLTTVEIGKIRYMMQTTHLVVVSKKYTTTSVSQQRKIFERMLSNSENGVDLMEGLYYDTSKGRKPIKEINKHTFKNHSVLLEENKMGFLKEVVDIYKNAVEKNIDEITKRSIEIIMRDIKECANSGVDHINVTLENDNVMHKESVKRVISHFKDLGFVVDTGETLSPIQVLVIIKWCEGLD